MNHFVPVPPAVVENETFELKKWIYRTTEELATKIIELKECPQAYKIEQRRDFVKTNFDLNNIIVKIQSVLEKHYFLTKN